MELITLIAKTHSLQLDTVIIPKTRGGYPEVTVKQLIEGILQTKNLKELAELWGFKYNTLKIHFLKKVKPLFPDKKNNSSWKRHLLTSIELKECSGCLQVLPLESFGKASCSKDNIRSVCKTCASEYQKTYKQENRGKFVEYQASRDAAKISRTPSWADKEKIKEIYKNCPEGYEVDHIIPLQGKLVSGLHIETNLQYLTKESNSRKGNRFDPGTFK